MRMRELRTIYKATQERLAAVENDLQEQPSDMVYAALIGRKYAYLEVLEMIEERCGNGSGKNVSDKRCV